MPPGGWQQPVQQQQPFSGAFASWWSRVGATLLDGLILLIPVILLFIIVGGIVGAGSEAGAIVTLIVGVLAFVIASLLYAPVLMARGAERNGQTFGKQIVGIRVVRTDRRPYTFGTSAVREILVKGLLFGTASSFLFGIPTLLDYLWPLWDDENRSLHDMIVSSRVVQA